MTPAFPSAPGSGRGPRWSKSMKRSATAAKSRTKRKRTVPATINGTPIAGHRPSGIRVLCDGRVIAYYEVAPGAYVSEIMA
jgi:hypothetical protein